PHTLTVQDLCLELCALDFSMVSPQTAAASAQKSHKSLLRADRHRAGTGSVSATPLQSQADFLSRPKINASEGIHRREKKAWTLGRQDCFVFHEAKSLFTRRLLF
ncbi:hypothetical protein N332_11621, partial [Mesitornis unicolor]